MENFNHVIAIAAVNSVDLITVLRSDRAAQVNMSRNDGERFMRRAVSIKQFGEFLVDATLDMDELIEEGWRIEIGSESIICTRRSELVDVDVAA
ncbi:MAG: hypothetical protein WCT54_00585 [Patescibacteria group bacterium]